MATTEVVLRQGSSVISAAEAEYLPAVGIQVALQRRTAVLEFYRSVMVPNVDFGGIPGIDKPTLLKPGAEKLVCYFGFSPEYIVESSIEDWHGENKTGEPMIYYRIKCRLSKNGRVIGEGSGSCSSWESKYRRRWVAEEDVPAGMDKTKLKSRGGARKITETDYFIDRAELNPRYGKTAEYWQRFRDAIQDGTAKRTKKVIKDVERDAWEISISEMQYQVPNPEVFDQANTVLKMAEKRALVSAALIATSASEFFTQDLDEIQATDPDPRGETIQTGGAQRNTQAAADAVGQRKVEEMRKAAPAPQPAPAPAPNLPPPPSGDEVPEQVQQLWRAMGTKVG